MFLFRPFDPQYYEDEFEDEEMLDEEGRTRLKLKVCVCVYDHTFSFLLKMKWEFGLSLYSNANCPVSYHRWKIQFGGEPKETRREMKRGRATHVLSNGLMAGMCCRCDISVCGGQKEILCVFVFF